MFQRHCSCPQRELFRCKDGWRIILVGSRFTHAAESCYAAIEGEALAVAEALQRCRHLVLGCTDLYIAVDHKPLVKIFGDRALADISNARRRRHCITPSKWFTSLACGTARRMPYPVIRLDPTLPMGWLCQTQYQHHLHEFPSP